jgi:transcriptional regulator
VAGVLRRQLGLLQPEVAVADPAQAHPRRLEAILGVTVAVDRVRAKFKYGGNVDEAHRRAVAGRLRARGGPGDEAAARHTERRLGPGAPP